jgi:hypothetical protein
MTTKQATVTPQAWVPLGQVETPPESLLMASTLIFLKREILIKKEDF